MAKIVRDFCEAAALSFRNAVDLPGRDAREVRYKEVIKRYEKPEYDRFPLMLATLAEGMQDNTFDYMGELFHELELHNTYKGQFFTPFALCEGMARMTVDDAALSYIEDRGFIRASEPACGSGGMVLALAKHLKENLGINFQQHLHVIATDIDSRCVHMAYLQMSLLFIPAIVVHGDTLRLQEFDHWHTNAHIMQGWTFKLRRDRELNPGDHPSDQFTRAASGAEPSKPQTAERAERPAPIQLTLF